LKHVLLALDPSQLNLSSDLTYKVKGPPELPKMEETV